jgi:hypothetical protein
LSFVEKHNKFLTPSSKKVIIPCRNAEILGKPKIVVELYIVVLLF